MGSVFTSIKVCFSTLVHAIERISLCTVCAILTCSLCFTVLMVLSVGIGIGYHYCYVQNTVNTIEQETDLSVNSTNTRSTTMIAALITIATTIRPKKYKYLYKNTKNSKNNKNQTSMINNDNKSDNLPLTSPDDPTLHTHGEPHDHKDTSTGLQDATVPHTQDNIPEPPHDGSLWIPQGDTHGHTPEALQDNTALRTYDGHSQAPHDGSPWTPQGDTQGLTHKTPTETTARFTLDGPSRPRYGNFSRPRHHNFSRPRHHNFSRPRHHNFSRLRYGNFTRLRPSSLSRPRHSSLSRLLYTGPPWRSHNSPLSPYEGLSQPPVHVHGHTTGPSPNPTPRSTHDKIFIKSPNWAWHQVVNDNKQKMNLSHPSRTFPGSLHNLSGNFPYDSTHGPLHERLHNRVHRPIHSGHSQSPLTFPPVLPHGDLLRLPYDWLTRPHRTRPPWPFHSNPPVHSHATPRPTHSTTLVTSPAWTWIRGATYTVPADWDNKQRMNLSRPSETRPWGLDNPSVTQHLIKSSAHSLPHGFPHGGVHRPTHSVHNRPSYTFFARLPHDGFSWPPQISLSSLLHAGPPGSRHGDPPWHTLGAPSSAILRPTHRATLKSLPTRTWLRSATHTVPADWNHKQEMNLSHPEGLNHLLGGSSQGSFHGSPHFGLISTYYDGYHRPTRTSLSGVPQGSLSQSLYKGWLPLRVSPGRGPGVRQDATAKSIHSMTRKLSRTETWLPSLTQMILTEPTLATTTTITTKTTSKPTKSSKPTLAVATTCTCTTESTLATTTTKSSTVTTSSTLEPTLVTRTTITRRTATTTTSIMSTISRTTLATETTTTSTTEPTGTTTTTTPTITTEPKVTTTTTTLTTTTEPTVTISITTTTTTESTIDTITTTSTEPTVTTTTKMPTTTEPILTITTTTTLSTEATFLTTTTTTTTLTPEPTVTTMTTTISTPRSTFDTVRTTIIPTRTPTITLASATTTTTTTESSYATTTMIRSTATTTPTTSSTPKITTTITTSIADTTTTTTSITEPTVTITKTVPTTTDPSVTTTTPRPTTIITRTLNTATTTTSLQEPAIDTTKTILSKTEPILAITTTTTRADDTTTTSTTEPTLDITASTTSTVQPTLVTSTNTMLRSKPTTTTTTAIHTISITSTLIPATTTTSSELSVTITKTIPTTIPTTITTLTATIRSSLAETMITTSTTEPTVTTTTTISTSTSQSTVTTTTTIPTTTITSTLAPTIIITSTTEPTTTSTTEITFDTTVPTRTTMTLLTTATTTVPTTTTMPTTTTEPIITLAITTAPIIQPSVAIATRTSLVIEPTLDTITTTTSTTESTIFTTTTPTQTMLTTTTTYLPTSITTSTPSAMTTIAISTRESKTPTTISTTVAPTTTITPTLTTTTTYTSTITTPLATAKTKPTATMVLTLGTRKTITYPILLTTSIPTHTTTTLVTTTVSPTTTVTPTTTSTITKTTMLTTSTTPTTMSTNKRATYTTTTLTTTTKPTSTTMKTSITRQPASTARTRRPLPSGWHYDYLSTTKWNTTQKYISGWISDAPHNKPLAFDYKQAIKFSFHTGMPLDNSFRPPHVRPPEIHGGPPRPSHGFSPEPPNEFFPLTPARWLTADLPGQPFHPSSQTRFGEIKTTTTKSTTTKRTQARRPYPPGWQYFLDLESSITTSKTKRTRPRRPLPPSWHYDYYSIESATKTTTTTRHTRAWIPGAPHKLPPGFDYQQANNFHFRPGMSLNPLISTPTGILPHWSSSRGAHGPPYDHLAYGPPYDDPFRPRHAHPPEAHDGPPRSPHGFSSRSSQMSPALSPSSAHSQQSSFSPSRHHIAGPPYPPLGETKTTTSTTLKRTRPRKPSPPVWQYFADLDSTTITSKSKSTRPRGSIPPSSQYSADIESKTKRTHRRRPLPSGWHYDYYSAESTTKSTTTTGHTRTWVKGAPHNLPPGFDFQQAKNFHFQPRMSPNPLISTPTSIPPHGGSPWGANGPPYEHPAYGPPYDDPFRPRHAHPPEVQNGPPRSPHSFSTKPPTGLSPLTPARWPSLIRSGQPSLSPSRPQSSDPPFFPIEKTKSTQPQGLPSPGWQYSADLESKTKRTRHRRPFPPGWHNKDSSTKSTTKSTMSPRYTWTWFPGGLHKMPSGFDYKQANNFSFRPGIPTDFTHWSSPWDSHGVSYDYPVYGPPYNDPLHPFQARPLEVQDGPPRSPYGASSRSPHGISPLTTARSQAKVHPGQLSLPTRRLSEETTTTISTTTKRTRSRRPLSRMRQYSADFDYKTTTSKRKRTRSLRPSPPSWHYDYFLTESTTKTTTPSHWIPPSPSAPHNMPAGFDYKQALNFSFTPGMPPDALIFAPTGIPAHRGSPWDAYEPSYDHLAYDHITYGRIYHNNFRPPHAPHSGLNDGPPRRPSLPRWHDNYSITESTTKTTTTQIYTGTRIPDAPHNMSAGFDHKHLLNLSSVPGVPHESLFFTPNGIPPQWGSPWGAHGPPYDHLAYGPTYDDHFRRLHAQPLELQGGPPPSHHIFSPLTSVREPTRTHLKQPSLNPSKPHFGPPYRHYGLHRPPYVPPRPPFGGKGHLPFNSITQQKFQITTPLAIHDYERGNERYYGHAKISTSTTTTVSDMFSMYYALLQQDLNDKSPLGY